MYGCATMSPLLEEGLVKTIRTQRRPTEIIPLITPSMNVVLIQAAQFPPRPSQRIDMDGAALPHHMHVSRMYTSQFELQRRRQDLISLPTDCCSLELSYLKVGGSSGSCGGLRHFTCNGLWNGFLAALGISIFAVRLDDMPVSTHPDVIHRTPHGVFRRQAISSLDDNEETNARALHSNAGERVIAEINLLDRKAFHPSTTCGASRKFQQLHRV